METSERTKLAPGAMVLLAALGYGVYSQGAYHHDPHRFFAVAVGVAGALLLVRAQGRRAGLVAAIAVSPLLVSSAISAALSDDRGDARSTFLTIALVGIAFAAGLSVSEHRPLMVDWLIVVAVVVGATAIWGVATHTAPFGRITEGVWRGSSSLTYSNAAAAVTGSVAVLTFHLAATRAFPMHAVACTFMLTAFVSTQSRGGALALLVLIVATLFVLGPRVFARTAVSISVGTAIASAPILLTASDSGSAQPVLVIAALVLGLTVTSRMFAIRERFLHPTITLASLVVGSVLIAWTTGLGSGLTKRLTLRSGTTAGGEDAAVLFGDRANEWSAAWDRFVDSPLVGHGPGVVDIRWSEGGRLFSAIFVHNEYLELLVTNGLLGLVALLASTVLFVRSGRRSEVSTAALLAAGMFMVHSTVDFLWHVPALPVFFAFLLGLSRTFADPVIEAEANT